MYLQVVNEDDTKFSWHIFKIQNLVCLGTVQDHDADGVMVQTLHAVRDTKLAKFRSI
eukprot:SAG31_NODE_2416_length_5732_cov_1.503462_4_plen_57_part_00